MRIRTIQDILPLVERPSRYLGSEINTVKKDPNKVKLKIALAFPDLYEIGTSHFGIQILYHTLNAHPEISAERAFAPAADMESYLRKAGLPIHSLESSRPLGDFDIIGFSLLYELNYTNILTVLELAGIPFYASERDGSYPLIIAGGPCCCNPEPVADFFDAIVIGDGEAVINQMALSWMNWEKTSPGNKEALLKIWSRIEGVYIPSFFRPEYDSSGFQTLKPKFSNYTKVTRAIVNDLNKVLFPESPVIPYGKPIHDRLRLEISRGCTRGCRFCQAGMIYRPVRERSADKLIALSDASLDATGYEDISLLSLSTGDYGCIAPLMENLMNRCENKFTAVSLPSIRAGTLTPKIMNLIKRVRKTGFTIAPEAGSQRLRNVINKNISNREIIETVENAFNLGWQVIKLYFMIGLPTERDEDLQALVDLVRDLRKIKKAAAAGKKAGGQINVSIATFIPKPQTPFQWTAQLSLPESKEKLKWLKQNLRLRGVRLKWQNPEVSFLEGIWSRGDRRLARLLVKAYQKGCKFDGWSDRFRFDKWQKAISETDINADFYTTRSRDLAEPLPWDLIDIKVTKSFLIRELTNALEGKSTSDCRDGNCISCGVCDFKEIAPLTFETCQEILKPADPKAPKPHYITYKVSYQKKDLARFFGHLELVNIFLRALRRADISVKYSEGFHPLPRVSFEDPLPLGIESQSETLYVTVPDSLKPQTIVNGLNRQLPAGLKVQGCQPAPPRSRRCKTGPAVYQITLNDGFFDQKAIKSFKESSEAIITRKNKKGEINKINLKEWVTRVDLLAPNKLELRLNSKPGKTIRPFAVLANIFSLTDESLKQARIKKISNQ
jgi:radical SAM family uncharacterized protein/radical SAM-linked protein